MSTVVGHGVDLIDLAEFEALVRSSGDAFLGRCFTEGELKQAGDGTDRVARLAARFAAKEAVLKSLGTGWVTGISWKDIEVVKNANGAPSIQVTKEVGRLAEEKGARRFHLSLSHARTAVVASVIATDR